MDHMRFRTIREGLGMTRYDVVKAYDVRERTVREWEAGTRPIPPAVSEDMAARFNTFRGQIDVLSAFDGKLVIDGSTRENRVLAFAALQQGRTITIEGKQV